MTGRPDLAFDSGDAALGFTWWSPRCGQRPAAVRVTLANGVLDVPLRGPAPPCSPTGRSILIPGASGNHNEPLQGPPPSWQDLSATLSVERATGRLLKGVRVTFRNSGGTDVALAPIPTYVVGVTDTNGDGTNREVAKPLPYPTSGLIVPAHESLTMQVPDVDISRDAGNFVSSRITVSFAIAGVPTAITTVPFLFPYPSR